MKSKERLIVALDVDSLVEAMRLVDGLSPEIDIFKVGISPFTAYGDKIIDKIHSMGKKVFLDLKVHDIPNTVKNAASRSAEKKVFMMNFHCIGGKEMLTAAVQGAGTSTERPILLGVTVLTSTGEDGLKEIGITSSVKDKVLDFASLAKEAGLDGVVASAEETKMIKEKLGKDFIVVTPGIRPEWAAKGDQKRALTPKEALDAGSDYLVVGRPIIAAEDPLEAAKRIIREME